MKLDNENAIEVFSSLVRTAGMDPKTPRGTRPGIGLSEIGAALGYADDGIGGDMVLAIATQDTRMADRIISFLESQVWEEAKRRHRMPDGDPIREASHKAFYDVVYGVPQPNGASPYYRWARSEFYGRAVNTAILACRRLFMEAA